MANQKIDGLPISNPFLDVVKGIGEAIKSLQNIPSMYYSRFIGYASQEVRKGRPLNDVLSEFDPSLATLFKAIIDAANSRISEVIRLGIPLRKALSDYYPGLEYLYDLAISQVTNGNSDGVLFAQIEKLLQEVSAVADGDLRVQAEITPDLLGVVADTINYLIEELASIIIRVQMITITGIESTNGTLEAIQERKKGIETISKTITENNTPLSERSRILIADQAKQIDSFLVNTETETMRINRLMDQLYASVSNFRLPQNVNGINSSLLRIDAKSNNMH
jgi:methyl-accepting chemotaxis protein